MNCYHWICMIYHAGMMTYIEDLDDVAEHGCEMAEQFDAVCKGYVNL